MKDRIGMAIDAVCVGSGTAILGGMAVAMVVVAIGVAMGLTPVEEHPLLWGMFTTAAYAATIGVLALGLMWAGLMAVAIWVAAKQCYWYLLARHTPRAAAVSPPVEATELEKEEEESSYW